MRRSDLAKTLEGVSGGSKHPRWVMRWYSVYDRILVRTVDEALCMWYIDDMQLEYEWRQLHGFCAFSDPHVAHELGLLHQQQTLDQAVCQD